ncbi:MAG: hypothetical protein J5506_05285 [Prevotella sp.]|nr:hypothetical protein [Prevotella sp.]
MFDKTYWLCWLSVALAVGVYCFWYFGRPYLLLAREQSQLFLWNCDYLTERLVVPGGLAQYVGEMLVQFFVKPAYGALIYAVLFLLTQWLTWRILCGKRKEERGNLQFDNLQFTISNTEHPKGQYPNDQTTKGREKRGRRKVLLYLLSLVPPLVLLWAGTKIYVPLTLTVGVVATLAVMAFMPKGKWARIVVVLLMVTVGYWLLGPAVVLTPLMLLPLWKESWSSWVCALAMWLVLLACVLGSSWLTPYPLRQVARGIDYYWEQKKLGKTEEMRYDMLLRAKQWEKVVSLYYAERPQSLALQSASALAMFHTGRINEQMLQQSLSVSNKSIGSQSTAFIMSDVYIQLGMSNMAQRAAFEAMEAVPNYNKSGRALLRLVETNLVAGQTEVAKKYIRQLEQTTFYRGHARQLRRFAEQPSLLDKHPKYGTMRKLFKYSKDVFFY